MNIINNKIIMKNNKLPPYANVYKSFSVIGASGWSQHFGRVKTLMCTMSSWDCRLQVLHGDLSWKINPDGLVKQAEPDHFLKEAEEKPLSASLWGSRAALPQTEKGFRISSQLSKGSLALPSAVPGGSCNPG